MREWWRFGRDVLDMLWRTTYRVGYALLLWNLVYIGAWLGEKMAA